VLWIASRRYRLIPIVNAGQSTPHGTTFKAFVLLR